jgi:hypothetical protein
VNNLRERLFGQLWAQFAKVAELVFVPHTQPQEMRTVRWYPLECGRDLGEVTDIAYY